VDQRRVQQGTRWRFFFFFFFLRLILLFITVNYGKKL
jgi:hypothetical protein